MPHKARTLNWFQRHLNGTAILAILVALTFSSFGSMEAAETVVAGLGALVNDVFLEREFDSTELVFILIGLAVCLPILGWTLKQKNRSLWWTLIAFVPLGWIAFLFLKNRGELVDVEYGKIMQWRYWGRLRQALCWVGVVAVVVLVVFASRYDLPVVGGYWDFFEYEAMASGRWEWVEIKDYTNAPLWVKIGSQHGLIPAIVGVFLLYGALKK